MLLRAYFCAHRLIRARSYVVIPHIGIAVGLLLQIRMSWLRALSKGVSVLVLVWRRTFLFQPVAYQQVVGFCLAIWVYAGVIST